MRPRIQRKCRAARRKEEVRICRGRELRCWDSANDGELVPGWTRRRILVENKLRIEYISGLRITRWKYPSFNRELISCNVERSIRRSRQRNDIINAVKTESLADVAGRKAHSTLQRA